MSVLGWILMVFGSFWCFGRILNQGDMYRSFVRLSSEKGVFFGIQRYIIIEFIMGFGMGTFLLSLGYFLVYDFIPLKLCFGLFACLFYILSCNIGYINITERITRVTDLTFGTNKISSTVFNYSIRTSNVFGIYIFIFRSIDFQHLTLVLNFYNWDINLSHSP